MWCENKVVLIVAMSAVLLVPAHYSGAQSWETVNVGGLYIGSYTDVWGSSENDVFITGNDGILHYDGSQWTEMTIPVGAACCSSVWGISSSDVYATGNGVLLHYNGASWSEVNIGAQQSVLTSTDLFDVWAGRGSGQDRVVVLGSSGRIFTKTGATWSVGGTSIYPNVAIRGDGDTYTRTYWYPSTYLGDPFYYQSWRFDGASWLVQDEIQQGGAVFHFGWGIDIGTPSMTTIGVGNNVTASYDSTGAATVIASPVSGDSYFNFTDITGTPGKIFAVGHNGFTGKILSYVGLAWADVTPTGLTTFTDIWGSHLKDLWVLTSNAIRHWGYSVSGTDLRLSVDVIQTVLEPSTFTQGKPIYVRAFLTCPGCSSTTSGSGTMTLSFDGYTQQVTRTFYVIPGESLDDQRRQPQASFNFTIPAEELELSSGVMDKQLELTLTGTLGVQSITKTWAREIEIEYLKPLTIGIGWMHLISGGMVFSPTLRDEEQTIQHIRELYPGQVNIRFLGSAEFDVDAVGDEATCDDNCLSQRILEDANELFVKGLFGSSLFQGVDYVHALTPDITTDNRLNIGGVSDPYWRSPEALGYASVGPRLFMSHEVGHNLGLQHPGWTPYPDAGSPTYLAGDCPSVPGLTMLRDLPSGGEHTYEWPFTDAFIHTWGWGPEPEQLKVTDQHYDFMSYCGDLDVDSVADTGEWVSGFHYERLLGKVAAPPHTMPAKSSLTGERVGKLPEQRAAFQTLSLQTYLVVKAVVNADDSVELIRAESMTSEVSFPRAPTSGGPTDYCISIENGGAPLDTQCYAVTFLNDDLEPLDQVSILSFLDANPATTHVTVRKGGVLLGSIVRSPAAPVISDVSVTPIEAGYSFTVCWTATDGDGDPLTFSVYFSPHGAEWLPVAIDQHGSCASVELGGLPATTSGVIRVIATDGVNTASQDAGATIVVDDLGPFVYLAHSDDVGDLQPGAFRLAATAFDAEDGDLPATSIVWKNAGGTTIGTGEAMVQVSDPVQHYTVSATDLDSHVTTRSVTLRLAIEKDIFSDGFESGTTAAWSATAP